MWETGALNGIDVTIVLGLPSPHFHTIESGLEPEEVFMTVMDVPLQPVGGDVNDGVPGQSPQIPVAERTIPNCIKTKSRYSCLIFLTFS